MTQSPIATYLQQGSNTLGSLLTKLNQLNTWNSWLCDYLPQEKLLTQHCRIVGLDGTSLIVVADNSHWVTRFRFFIPSLLVQLQTYADFRHIRAICCKVRPPHYHASSLKIRRSRLTISSHTAEILHATASKIHHEKLKKILTQLAEHAKNQQE